MARKTEIIHKSAQVSSCGLFRYDLRRWWDVGAAPLLPFILLNPSTADGLDDDATVRKGYGFARKFGFGGIHFANEFAFRTRHPKEMKVAADPVGPANDSYLKLMASTYDFIVCAWGGNGDFLDRDVAVLEILRQEGCVPMCLGTTQRGLPNHPLMLPYSCELQEYAGR